MKLNVPSHINKLQITGCLKRLSTKIERHICCFKFFSLKDRLRCWKITSDTYQGPDVLKICMPHKPDCNLLLQASFYFPVLMYFSSFILQCASFSKVCFDMSSINSTDYLSDIIMVVNRYM